MGKWGDSVERKLEYEHELEMDGLNDRVFILIIVAGVLIGFLFVFRKVPDGFDRGTLAWYVAMAVYGSLSFGLLVVAELMLHVRYRIRKTERDWKYRDIKL